VLKNFKKNSEVLNEWDFTLSDFFHSLSDQPATQSFIWHSRSYGIASLTFSYYILQPVFPTCEPPDSAVRLIAACAICECSNCTPCSVMWTKCTFLLVPWTYFYMKSIYWMFFTQLS